MTCSLNKAHGYLEFGFHKSVEKFELVANL